MELFWDLAFTIAFSLMLPLIFIKLLSVTPDYDANEKEAIPVHDHRVQSDIQKMESEEVVRIAGRFDEFVGESTLQKLSFPETVDFSYDSSIIRYAGKIDENGTCRETEVVDLAEDPVEQNCDDFSLISVCEKSSAKDESNQGTRSVVEVELTEGESGLPNVAGFLEISLCGLNFDEIEESNKNRTDSENDELLDEDDWEGIERTELERLFGAAVAFVGSESNANQIASLNNDVKMQLYGFHKIATQGPCRQPQPMALKFSARAKWYAWQQLGIMSPELAMERYVTILTESIPAWMPDYPNGISNSVQASEKLPFDLKTQP